MTSYEKQMKWAKARQKETDAKRIQKAESEDNFHPQMFHARVKEFEGSARDINDRSAQKFIERMRRGNGLGSSRSVHSASNESLLQNQQADPNKIQSSSFSTDGIRRSPAHIPQNSAVTNTIQNSNSIAPTNYVQNNNSKGAVSATDIVASYSGHFAAQGRPVISTGFDIGHNFADDPSEISKLDNGDDLSSGSDSGEPIIEMLERERRQWQTERERLIQCIHLQQLEMSQRALAAHERAVDIAKDFAKLIETFENRLEIVESNVQKELSGLKSVTESLLLAVAKLTLSNQQNSMTASTIVPSTPATQSNSLSASPAPASASPVPI